MHDHSPTPGQWGPIQLAHGEAGAMLDFALAQIGLPRYTGSALDPESPYSITLAQREWRKSGKPRREIATDVFVTLVNQGEQTPSYKMTELLREALGDPEAIVWAADAPYEPESYAYRNGSLNPPTALPRRTPRTGVVWFAMTIPGGLDTARIAYAVRLFDPESAPDPRCKSSTASVAAVDWFAAVDQLSAGHERFLAKLTPAERAAYDRKRELDHARFVLRSATPRPGWGTTQWPDEAERTAAWRGRDRGSELLSPERAATWRAQISAAEQLLATSNP